MSTVKLALAQYEVSAIASWQAFADRLTRWVTDAALAGADLLVFPEYTALELGALLPPNVFTQLDKQLPLLQEYTQKLQSLLSQLAQAHQVTLVVGGFPLAQGNQTYVNVAWVVSPQGQAWPVTKRILTRFEKSPWHLAPGESACVFEAPWGTFGVAICYDSEFPEIVTPLVEAGAQLIVVPTCTDTRAGYHRVRIGARARALENQCYVATAPLLGTAPWCEAIDVSVGAAGVFSPVDVGFSDNGIICEGTPESPGWVYTTLDFNALGQVADLGHVQNRADRPWAQRQGQSPVKRHNLFA